MDKYINSVAKLQQSWVMNIHFITHFQPKPKPSISMLFDIPPQLSLHPFSKQIAKPIPKPPITKPPITKPLPTDSIYFPQRVSGLKDSLFWCFYISANGFDDYAISSLKPKRVEMQYKIQCIEQLNAHKRLISSANSSFSSFSSFISMLSSNQQFTLELCDALCTVMQRPITFVTQDAYYLSGASGADNAIHIHVIHVQKGTGAMYASYGFECMDSATEYTFMISNRIKRDNIQQLLI